MPCKHHLLNEPPLQTSEQTAESKETIPQQTNQDKVTNE